MIALQTIQQMPLREKLYVMETLCRDEDGIEVPQWHKDLLDEREQLVASGEAVFIPWEVAKQQIRDSVR
jgi:Putative addiction module component